MKEFRTACYIEHFEKGEQPVPLLTTFIQTLEPDYPFQVSLHSWVPTGRQDVGEPNGGEYWQVRMLVDGVCVCIQSIPREANWPAIICTLTVTKNK